MNVFLCFLFHYSKHSVENSNKYWFFIGLLIHANQLRGITNYILLLEMPLGFSAKMQTKKFNSIESEKFLDLYMNACVVTMLKE